MKKISLMLAFAFMLSVAGFAQENKDAKTKEKPKTEKKEEKKEKKKDEKKEEKKEMKKPKN